MENLVIEGISHNLQYVFTNKGVTKISAQLNDLNGNIPAMEPVIRYVARNGR